MELLADNGTIYRSRLLDMGLQIAPTVAARNALFEYIIRSEPPSRVRAVTRPGWHGDVFVLPDGAIGGDESGEKVLWQSGFAIEHAFNTKGTLEGWRTNVASLCPGNSRLAFAISCALAAPLLYLTGSESGGFNFVGASSLGKTTVQRAAASVWGGAESDSGYLRQWRATANGIEATAALHCDALLALDELSQVDSREAGAVAYMLANGSGKSRSRRDGSGRPIANWRLLLLSSGEITLSDKIAEDRHRHHASAGQQVRIIDIPADAGAGNGIFENLHGAEAGYALANQLKGAATTYYGTAARAFLEELTAAIDVAEQVRAHRDDWKSKNCPPGANYQVERVAGRFGLVAAAGELAIAFGILPWGKGEADWAAAKCFAAWLERRGHLGAADIESGIAAIRKFLELHGESRFYPAWNPPSDKNGNGLDRPTINRAGFRRGTDRGSEFFVLPEVWRTEVLVGFDAQSINKEMIERGLLLVNSDGKAASMERVPAFGAKRFYHISASLLTDDADADDEPSRREAKS